MRQPWRTAKWWQLTNIHPCFQVVTWVKTVPSRSKSLIQLANRLYSRIAIVKFLESSKKGELNLETTFQNKKAKRRWRGHREWLIIRACQRITGEWLKVDIWNQRSWTRRRRADLDGSTSKMKANTHNTYKRGSASTTLLVQVMGGRKGDRWVWGKSNLALGQELYT